MKVVKEESLKCVVLLIMADWVSDEVRSTQTRLLSENEVFVALNRPNESDRRDNGEELNEIESVLDCDHLQQFLMQLGPHTLH